MANPFSEAIKKKKLDLGPGPAAMPMPKPIASRPTPAGLGGAMPPLGAAPALPPAPKPGVPDAPEFPGDEPDKANELGEAKPDMPPPDFIANADPKDLQTIDQAGETDPVIGALARVLGIS